MKNYKFLSKFPTFGCLYSFDLARRDLNRIFSSFKTCIYLGFRDFVLRSFEKQRYRHFRHLEPFIASLRAPTHRHRFNYFRWRTLSQFTFSFWFQIVSLLLHHGTHMASIGIFFRPILNIYLFLQYFRNRTRQNQIMSVYLLQ